MDIIVLKQRSVKKVRKSHQCIWCGEEIKIGQPAQYTSQIQDGEFHDYYLHPECNIAVQQEISDCNDNCVFFDEWRVRGSVVLKGDLRWNENEKQKKKGNI